MMPKRMMVATGLAGVAVAGFAAGIGTAGGPAGDGREALAPVVGEPVVAVARGSAQRSARRAKRKRPQITFYYAPRPTIPPEGKGFVQAIKCPRGAGQPIAGGARTSVGIVVSYLSRVHPQTGKRPARTYFVGVDDNSAENDPESGALVEVQCAKGFAIRK